MNDDLQAKIDSLLLVMEADDWFNVVKMNGGLYAILFCEVNGGGFEIWKEILLTDTEIDTTHDVIQAALKQDPRLAQWDGDYLMTTELEKWQLERLI